MDKDYIEVKLPVLSNVDEMKVVETFTEEQLWYVCAIAKAFEKREQQCKKQKEVIDKVYELIKQHIRKDGFLELNEWQTRDLLDILKEVSE